VVVPGTTAPQLLPIAAVAQYPAAAAMAEDQSGGWKKVSDFLPAATPQQPAPPAFQQPAFPAFQQTASPAFQQPAAQNGVLPRGLFAGVANAQITRRGQYFNAGDYICRLTEATYKSGRSSNMVILELEIVESSYDDKDPARSKCNQPQSQGSVFIKQNDSFNGNMKEILIAVSGFDAAGNCRPDTDTVGPEECEALVSAEQPYKGALVYIEAREIITKENRPFTRISWWPCPKLQDGKPDTDKLMREVR
jgi:hypothetical protein